MTTSVLIRPGLPLLGQKRKHERRREEEAPAPAVEIREEEVRDCDREGGSEWRHQQVMNASLTWLNL